MNLPKIGTPQQFATLRDFLARSQFTEPAVCLRLGLRSVEELDLAALSQNLAECVATPETLNTLIRLFLLGEFVSVAESESQFSQAARQAMNALELLSCDRSDDTRCFANVALYPVGGLYIISDRWTNPDRSPKKSFHDVVYPALTKSTREFLSFLNTGPCENFLELCGGSGIAALAASRNATHSWATDIAARSTHFALFNKALNDASNVTVLQGDLYGPVEDLTFDRIAAHPPYMPVLRPAEIYYDGGEDGEQITRQIVEGLPRHLRPGGRLYCRSMGTDRPAAPFEQRIRKWLGDSESQFDVAFFVSKNLEPMRFAMETAVRKATGQDEVNQWKALFEKHQIMEILTGTVVVQRREGKRPVFTIRRSLAPRTNFTVTEWTLRWETEMLRSDNREWLMETKPVTSSRLQMIVRHRWESGSLTPCDFALRTDYPFLMDCQAQPWMCSLLAQCDGSKTIQQHYDDCRQIGWIHPDTPRAEFAGLLGALISGGFLEVAEFKLPAVTE